MHTYLELVNTQIRGGAAKVWSGYGYTRARAHTHTHTLSLSLSLTHTLSLTHKHTNTHSHEQVDGTRRGLLLIGGRTVTNGALEYLNDVWLSLDAGSQWTLVCSFFILFFSFVSVSR